MHLERESAPSVVLDQELPDHKVVAKNYAEASENKMHSDDVAGRYGYRGGLVPGVAVYAYMTVPVVQALGAPWLAHGSMRAKFIKPIYHGDAVTVRSRVTGVDPIRITISVVNEEEVLCAVGEASLPEKHPHLDISRYPYAPLPDPDEKLPPSLEVLTENTILGAIEFTIDPQHSEGEHGDFLDEMVETLPIYRGPDAIAHPAVLAQMANRLLIENVALGPWIHSGTDINYYDVPRPDEKMYMQGRIAHSYTKRGHEIVVMDVVALGSKERPIAHLTHTAIVRPNEVAD